MNPTLAFKALIGGEAPIMERLDLEESTRGNSLKGPWIATLSCPQLGIVGRHRCCCCCCFHVFSLEGQKLVSTAVMCMGWTVFGQYPSVWCYPKLAQATACEAIEEVQDEHNAVHIFFRKLFVGDVPRDHRGVGVLRCLRFVLFCFLALLCLLF